jgi:hypothetical protein
MNSTTPRGSIASNRYVEKRLSPWGWRVCITEKEQWHHFSLRLPAMCFCIFDTTFTMVWWEVVGGVGMHCWWWRKTISILVVVRLGDSCSCVCQPWFLESSWWGWMRTTLPPYHKQYLAGIIFIRWSIISITITITIFYWSSNGGVEGMPQPLVRRHKTSSTLDKP